MPLVQWGLRCTCGRAPRTFTLVLVAGGIRRELAKVGAVDVESKRAGPAHKKGNQGQQRIPPAVPDGVVHVGGEQREGECGYGAERCCCGKGTGSVH